MSNNLRAEKNCLNCGFTVGERFCTHCGQENIETKENFLHQLGHVVGDITHFDSKFLKTIKYLFTKPGFITLEYLKGKRIGYVHPVRLFIFTSFLFFLAVGLLPHTNKEMSFNFKADKNKVSNFSDSASYMNAVHLDSGSMNLINRYKTIEEYEEKQNTLPEKERDGFFIKRLIISTIKKRNESQALGINSVIDSSKESMLHKMHYGILILLPFFALLLKLFFRKSKSFYTEHLIFSFHLHTFILLMWIFSLLTDAIFNTSTLTYFFIGFLVYLIIALKNLYQNTWIRTILKTIFLSFSYAIFVGIFFSVLTFYTYLFN